MKTFLEISQTQQLVEPTEQNIQPPSGIITAQTPQSAEWDSNFPSQGAALDTSMVSTGSNSSTVQNISRLHKLILITFNGNPLYGQSFWDSYRAAVDDNPSLSDIQKFNYLRAQLLWDAMRSTAGFPLMLTTKEVSRYYESNLVNPTELLMPIWKQCLIYSIGQPSAFLWHIGNPHTWSWSVGKVTRVIWRYFSTNHSQETARRVKDKPC